MIESLQQSINSFQAENDRLRGAIRQRLGDATAAPLLDQCTAHAASAELVTPNPANATQSLDDHDYGLVHALQMAQQTFVITDPLLPDNPIVFASQGFLTLTGYSLDQVLGRNCRFLQGPATDPRSVAKIRKAIEGGYDVSVCLLNYKIDATTFWNHFFIAALRDGKGSIVNFVGVQCEVSERVASALNREELGPDGAAGADASEKKPAPGGGGGGGSSDDAP